MKNKKNIFISLMLCAVFFIAFAITPTFTQAADEKETVVWDSELNIKNFRGESVDVPTKEGYVFAGWYRESASGYTALSVAEADAAESAVAKFVDEKVLSVKCQITDDTTVDSASTALRLLTTVDTFNYSSVGFIISIGNYGTTQYTTSTVYKTISGSEEGGNVNYAPTEFSPISDCFATYKITQITTDRFGLGFTVTPIWTTLDGTTVRGVARSFMTYDLIDGKESVYGSGITVTPDTNGAAFTVTEQTVADGENAGKTYTRIEKITTQGMSKLIISATQAAGLLPNTEYEVALDVACDGSRPAYYEEHSGGNDFILETPGGTIKFTITTDANGEFIQAWNTIYIQTTNTYVDFTGITLTPQLGSVYGEGITVTPATNGAAFTVTEQTVADGENAGKTYTRIEKITTKGFSKLTIKATKEAGLLPNTEYEVALDVACDGSRPAYFEEHSGGNDFILGTPGGTIKFTITTDENGEFIQAWNTIYIQTSNTYVDFTGITLTPQLGSVYGEGITVTPATNGAAFSVTEQRFTEGENLGKTYTRIEKITTQGFSKLTIKATKEAGLLPNTEYEVALDVACDGSRPAYFEEHSGGNDFILGTPGGTIKFTITTDENGEFIQAWNTIYIQTSNTYVDFTGITLTPQLGSVYGEGITVTPDTNGAAFTVTEQTVADGENAGKTYTRIEKITTQGFSKLTIKATKEAGLLPNTEYEVALDVACDGSRPAYFEEHSGGNDFILGTPGGTIKFTITTDENGEFIQAWSTIYIQTTNTYVDFTKITLTQRATSVYGNGVTITPKKTGATAPFNVVEKTFEDGENAGKTYVGIENVTTPGPSTLTISVTKEANLKANTTYNVTVYAVMNGRGEAYFDQANYEFMFTGTSTNGEVTNQTITFEITTDGNGEFTKKWSDVYIKNRGATFYIYFTGIDFTEK